MSDKQGLTRRAHFLWKNQIALRTARGQRSRRSGVSINMFATHHYMYHARLRTEHLYLRMRMLIALTMIFLILLIRYREWLWRLSVGYYVVPVRCNATELKGADDKLYSRNDVECTVL